jgi:hypothetical protein
MNAAVVPVFTVNGATASIVFLLQSEQIFGRLDNDTGGPIGGEGM